MNDTTATIGAGISSDYAQGSRRFNRSQIMTAALSMETQLAAGHPLPDVLHRLASQQPARRQFWLDAAERVGHGGKLSECLEGFWHDGMVEAVRAGEASNNLSRVAERIGYTLEVSEKIRDAMMALVYPAFVVLGGYIVCLFYLVKVLPGLAGLDGSKSGNTQFIIQFSRLVKAVWDQQPALFVGAHIALAVVAILVLGQRQTQAALINWADGIPVLGEGIRNLYFGLWAYYLIMLDTAGIPIRQALTASAGIMPLGYQAGIVRMAEDVEQMGLANAADPDKHPADDPRQRWPYMIHNAFMLAHETKQLAYTLEKIAPSMIKVGLNRITRATTAINYLSILAVATLLSLPMMGYFAQLADSMAKAFK